MRVDSPHWNWEDGVCTKHMLPSVPCPACLASADPDLEAIADDTDLDVIAMEGIPLADLLPTNLAHIPIR